MFLSAESVAKSVLLFFTATAVCFASIPPQPKAQEEFREKFDAPSAASHNKSRSTSEPPWFDYKAAGTTFGLFYFPYLFSSWVVLMSALDATHTLNLFPRIMPVGHNTTSQIINAQLIVGLVLTTTAAALRFTAFRTLGKLFTYQLAILPEHKLVTNGIYAYCRHPSYTALWFIFLGELLMVTAPGSVVYDNLGIDSTIRLTILLGLAVAHSLHLFMHRAELEDQVLRKEFGIEWEEWARKVPYKFIPYVF